MNKSLNQPNRIGPHAVLSALALVAGLTLAVNRHVWAGEAADSKTAPAPGLSVDASPVPREGKTITSFSPVVKKVAPCVVTITTSSKPKNTQANLRLPDDPFFRRFFGEGPGGMENARPQKQYGLGSGVIVTKDGYILTNNHVAENADKIEVVLSDGREFTAKLVGADKASDVAVLKINAHDLPSATLADSDKIETGDIVLAIGNPFGIGQTVTMGMVSATGRTSMVEGNQYQDFIQTDAAINPGNSGGALVDVEGRLVGINTAILSRSGGNQGIGFAIPSDQARRVMVSLVRDGRVVRGYLGVLIQNLTPSLADEFKLHDEHGALIGEVLPNGPAGKAGIKPGDVVLRFDGKKIKDSNQLRLQVSETAPGTKVPVEIFRDGEKKSLEVALQELPSNEPKKSGQPENPATDTLNGVEVGDLDSSTRGQFQVPAEIHGAVVVSVDQNSVAAEAGLRAGDVITEINRKHVHNADEVVAATSHAKDRRTLLRIWRHDNSSNQGGFLFLVVDESNSNS